MNDRIARVFVWLLVPIVAIIALLTWWQVLQAGELRTRSYNNQTAYYEQRIKRGQVRSADGVVLARSRAETSPNGDQVFRRHYPQGSLAAHALGYSTFGHSRTGIERTHNDALTGSTRGLGNLVMRLEGNTGVTGDSLQLTINAEAQRLAQQALGDRRGAIVAMEPRTGRVRVMASSPTFDLNAVEDSFGQVRNQTGAPLLNRATQARYAPGSTFKVVTTAAALETGTATPDTSFPGGCSYDPSTGPPIANFGGSCFGGHDLTYALTNSVNTTFARLGEQIGQEQFLEQMERFGFSSTPPMPDLPSGERRTSGLYGDDGELLERDMGLDMGRVAIGQERLEATPLQMAMVVSAIANDGVLMQPYLVERVIDPQGREVRRARPEQVGRAVSRETAATLTEMMQNVVREGTGTAAALGDISVAGKTGTADTPSGNQVWFVAFAPATDPQVAIAVTIEGLPAGSTGGTIAAPIARDVMETLVGGRENLQAGGAR